MKKISLSDVETEQLVERFAEIGVQQDEAILKGETARFNRLYDQMDEIDHELRSRPGDHRRALIGLYGHPNIQVRLKAAIRTLAVAREEAGAVLKVIADTRRYPQAADARGLLRSLDDGSFQPN